MPSLTPLPACLASPTSWKQTLLEDELPPSLAHELVPFLKAEGQAFLDRTAEHPTAAEKDEADRWYGSAEGQQTLTALTRAIWAQMFPLAEHAMPAHDARHAMFKVPTSALEYVLAEDVQGYERVGVLGALLHDHGRWAEERIFGGPGASLVHARLSFLLSRELLGAFEMPAVVRAQILLAVIRHTSGADPEDAMPLKLTVAGDRDQLYGPEFVIRMFHHTVSDTGDSAAVYSSPPATSILDRMEHFQRNRLPGPLFAMQSHVDWLRWTQRMFLLMCEPAPVSRARFEFDVTGQGQAKRPIQPAEHGPYDWAGEWAHAQELRPQADDAYAQLEALLRLPNLAPGAHYRDAALAKLQSVPEHLLPTVAGSLLWVRQQVQWNDERQRVVLHRLARHDDALLATLSQLLLDHGA